MSNQTHIALVGCGQWGKLILRDLLALNCRVTVVSRSKESTDNAQKGGAHVIVNDCSAISDPDGIVVCTPTSTHFTVIDELLHTYPGVPIFSEKPLTNSVRDAEALAAAAPAHLFVMDKWRYHDGVLKLAELARSNKYGALRGIQTIRQSWGVRHKDVDPVWILLPHDLSIVMEILGDVPQPRAARLLVQDGRAYTISALLGDDPWVSCEVGCLHPKNVREIRLHFDNAVAILEDSYSPHIIVNPTARHWEMKTPTPIEISIESNMPLLEELKAFVLFVQQAGPAPKSSAAEALSIVRTVAELLELGGLQQVKV